MIPDDAVLIVRQDITTVVEREEVPGMVVFAAESGFPGILDPAALAHVYNRKNPHEDGIANIKLPGGEGGKWFVLGASGVEITDEEPLYPEDIHPVVSEDGLVRTDSEGPNLTLAGLAAYPLWSAGALRVRGDEKIAPRMFYGTDAAGTAGFQPVPGKQVIP